MTANVISFLADKSALLMTVTKTDELGRVTQCTSETGESALTVVAQLDSVASCQAGDQVLAWHTANGIVVLGKLLAEDQAPAVLPRDLNGHVVLSASQSVSLQSGKSSIDLAQAGQIQLQAEEIDATSQSDMNLTGWPIRLN